MPSNSTPSGPLEFDLLRSVDKISCLANQLRLEILGQLVDAPRTGSQVATALDAKPQLVHYHLGRLIDQGLVNEVAVHTETKGRSSERYFRAHARHFFVDPALACTDDATVSALIASVEAAMDAWQRREIFGVDLQAVAGRIVGEGLEVGPDDRVLIISQPQVREMVERLTIEVEARGGRASLRPWSRDYALARLDRVPESQLKSEPFAPHEDLDELSAVVFVSVTQPAGPEPTEKQRLLIPHLLRGLGEWQRAIRTRGVRYIELSIPSRGDLAAGDLSPVDATALFWRALSVSVDDLAAVASDLAAKVAAGADERGAALMHLEDPEGRRLELAVDARHPHLNLGRLTRADARAGRLMDEFPPGSIAWLPSPASNEKGAHGTLRAPYLASVGHVWRDLVLTFDGGRLVHLEGEEAELLRAKLDAAQGDASRIAEVRIGINPAGRARTGKASLDAVLEGAVTLALGSNEILGGAQSASLDLRFPSRLWSLGTSGEQLVRR